MKYYQTCFLLSYCIFLSSAASVPATAHRTCSFSGQSYEPGDKWHRRLENSGSVFCVACHCKEEGAVNCSSVSCDNIDCTTSEAANGDCCRLCQVPVEPPPIASPQVSCLHNGRVYQDSQTFASNSSGLQTHSPNQCVQCVCQAGQVLCRLKTCPTTHCSQDPSDCCPCQGGASTEQLQPSSVLVTFLLSQEMQTAAECTSGGVTYAHGSTWHPIIGPLGQMDCVICKCKSSRIECGRLSCPQPPSCVKLQPVQGQCCPICIDKVGDQESSVTEAQPTEPKPDITENYMCLPRPANTIVYRSHASSSNSAYYQYAFQVSATDKNTRLLSWTVKDGQIGDYSEQHLTKDEFVILTHTFKFKLLGATRSRFMEKFLRKAKRLPDRCGSRCSAKINRLEKVLHLKEFPERRQCLSTELKFE